MLCRRSRHFVVDRPSSILFLRTASNAFIKSLRPIEDVTRRLIAASAIGDVSYNHRDAGRLWSVIPQAERPSMPPSLDKAQFVAQSQLSSSDLDPTAAELLDDVIYPGAFVELRRNFIVTHGIVLQMKILEARQHSITLTYTGEVWPHLINDITYSIPGFVSQDLLERAGNGYEATSTTQTTARLQIVEQVRTFTRQHERHFNALAKDIRPVYDKVRHKDPEKWAYITTPEAARLLDVRKPPPVLTLYAMHVHMMSLPLYYVADPHNHKTTHRFSIRPLSHVQIILQVNDWVRKNDPGFQAFTATARTVIKKSREIQKVHWDERPSFFDGRFAPWSPTDLIFIRYLQNALRTTRSTQDDPYDRALPSIVKAIGMYNDHIVSPGLAQLLLTEIGVLAPWDDVVTRMPTLRLDVTPSEQSTEAQTVDELAQHNITHRDMPVSPLLKRRLRDIRLEGTTELLKRDTFENQRHDFGDLPIYIVDDALAQELDDGISIEDVPGEPGNSWVHVHVADPTSTIPAGHVFHSLARRNVTSFYSAHRTWPMLPSAITQPFSLGKMPRNIGQEVLTFSMKMSHNAEFLDYKVRVGLVRNMHTLTYDQVDHALGLKHSYHVYPFPETPRPGMTEDPIPENYCSDLRKLRELSDCFFRRTLRENPIISFTFPKALIRFQETISPNPLLPPRPILWKGFPLMTYFIEDPTQCPYSFRQTVAEWMKLAGRAASRFCRDNGVPAIRRASLPFQGSSAADLDKLLSLRSPSGYVDPFECVKRNMYAPPGEPTLDTRGHWGLGIPDGEGYCRVTSPLRRYGDLLMHWQIKHAIQPGNNAPLFSAEHLKPIMVQIHERERTLLTSQAVYHKHWALSYLARYIQSQQRKHGDDFNPLPDLLARTISSVGFDALNSTGQVPVVIPSLGVQGELRGVDITKPLPIGTPISVKVAKFKMAIPPLLQLVLA